MTDSNFFNGGPSTPTPISASTSPKSEPRATPVVGAHVNDNDRFVKRPSSPLDAYTPRSLLTDAGLDAFLRWTTASLERALPEWMAEHAWEGAVIAALKARKAPNNFDSIRQVYAYARLAAVRAATRTRRQRHAREVELTDAHSPVDPHDFERSVHQRQRLLRALLALPEAERRAYVATKGLGKSVAEFAAEEGIALSTVMNRVCKAHVRLVELLAEANPQ